MHTYAYAAAPSFGILDFAWHVLVLVAVVWVIVMIIRAFSGHRFMGPGRWHMYDKWQSHSALSILNERFAKGEIDAKEYEERKKALMGDGK